MSTNKQSIASSEHDDVPAAPLPSPVASLSQRTPLESLRQADGREYVLYDPENKKTIKSAHVKIIEGALL